MLLLAQAPAPQGERPREPNTRGMTGRLSRVLFGRDESIARTVYGTIVVMAATAAGSRGHETDVAGLAVLVAVTAFVLYIAHVYSHALAESLQRGRRLDAAELASVARRELAIVLAAVGPVGVLVLGAAGALDAQAAVRAALGVGVVVLAVQGLRYALLERLHGAAVALLVALNVGLGLAIVALEVLVAH
jgi:hypothetical protein